MARKKRFFKRYSINEKIEHAGDMIWELRENRGYKRNHPKVNYYYGFLDRVSPDAQVDNEKFNKNSSYRAGVEAGDRDLNNAYNKKL